LIIGSPEYHAEALPAALRRVGHHALLKIGTGGIVHFVEVNPMPKAGGKWNTYEITAKGRQIIVMLNGQKTAELNNGCSPRGRSRCNTVRA
jgi:hypothetical protein